MDNNRIPFNFTYFAMKLLGKNLYSNPWTAVSEIVANSIDAMAKTVFVLIDIRNKEKAIVEIFDDGTGMTETDLREKYTLIGRNRRLDNDNKKGKTLGRKGIGKLAALYLSPRYYLITKTNGVETAWVVDTQSILDSDVPALTRTNITNEMLVSSNNWNCLSTGTMIHLSDVDLRRIGSERLKSLPIMLADYYLESEIQTKIKVCVIEKDEDNIEFHAIKKQINFETLYGIFDNTKNGYKNRIKKQVYLTDSNSDKAVDFPRNTIVLDEKKYSCNGTFQLTNLNGIVETVDYSMRGWIGIHSSLKNEILSRNSTNAKKIQNHPNALRLYVRGKLAVNNLMNYVASTAAFASYIEGEISFDILDDDRFEDAATSNREGYSINDPRIKKLLEIVGKIISSLVIERNKAGNQINEELKAIKEKKEKELESERQQRIAAEKHAQEEEDKAKKENEERQKAEKERDTALADNESAKQRLFVLENNFTSSGETYKHAVHLSVNFAKEIRSVVSDYCDCADMQKEEITGLFMDIDRSAAKIESLPKFVESATFSLSSPNIKLDVVKLIQDYIESHGNNRLQYIFHISDSIIKEVEFTDVLMLVENIISNSIKAKATQLIISCEKVNGKHQIDFMDNGCGLAPKYSSNPQAIFELGETTTPGGFGIGGYHIKEIVEKMGGKVFAINSEKLGLIIRVEL